MTGDPLFGPAVEAALARLPGDLDPLRAVSALRGALDPGLARRASELFALRRRALLRFPDGRLAFLSAKGLEQASRPEVAEARAARVRAGGASRVWDATCGVGADSLALAASGIAVLASDLDPFHARCTAANLERRAGGGLACVADACRPPVRPSADCVIVDPDRRAGGERSLDPRRWSPTLDTALRTARRFPSAAIKLPPGFDPWRHGLELELEGAHAWEWVSVRRQLCELTLWTGTAALGVSEREALAIDASGAATRLQGPPVAVSPLDDGEAVEGAWLAEPDPAVIRSGLVGRLAEQLDLRPIAPRIAYLVGARRPASALVRSWRIVATSPLDPRRVRNMLGAHGIGPVEVKKRGHPETAEALARRLRGPGERRGLLAVTRLRHGHLAMLIESVDAGSAASERVGDEGFEPPTSSL